MRNLILVIAVMTFCLSIVIPHSLACKQYMAISPGNIYATPSPGSKVVGTYLVGDFFCVLETKDMDFGSWMAVHYDTNSIGWIFATILIDINP